jgi:uncharacterized membrane protein YeaQ/YmgE (transglycosylase-associated protein family)
LDEVNALSGLVGRPTIDFIVSNDGYVVGLVASSVVKTEVYWVGEIVLGLLGGYCRGKETSSKSKENRGSHIDLLVYIVFGVLHLLMTRAESWIWACLYILHLVTTSVTCLQLPRCQAAEEGLLMCDKYRYSVFHGIVLC